MIGPEVDRAYRAHHLRVRSRLHVPEAMRRVLHGACVAMMVIAFLSPGELRAQTVYFPLHHPVYDFLDRIEARYGYSLPSFSRPFERRDIAALLDSLGRSGRWLTPYDKSQLQYYREEFWMERRMAASSDSAAHPSNGNRWNLLNVHATDPFRGEVVVNLIGRAGYTRRQDADNVVERSNGVAAHGYLGANMGFLFRWYDNAVDGIPFDAKALRTPVQGVVRQASGSGTSYEYEVAEGQWNYSNAWLTVGLQKMDLWMGSGRVGSIILSDKPPAYPRFSFTVRLGDWLRFSYFHAWLFSDSLDFARTYYPKEGQASKFFETKYLASHAVIARVLPNLELSMGESIIYSGGDINILFLIPVISFRAADRWTGATTGNSQFFADVRYSPVKRATLYGTGFIDELVVSRIFSGGAGFNYQVAYTIGGFFPDLYWTLLPLASESRIEFSRVYPFVYTNPNPTQQYTSHSTTLGHWINTNADVLSIQHMVHPFRWFDVEIRYTYARFGNATQPSYDPALELIQPAFLFRHEYSTQTLRASIGWHPIHDLSVNGWLQYVKLTRMLDYTSSPDVPGLSIGGAVSFGIW
jgi:hypothetical protein